MGKVFARFLGALPKISSLRLLSNYLPRLTLVKCGVGGGICSRNPLESLSTPAAVSSAYTSSTTTTHHQPSIQGKQASEISAKLRWPPCAPLHRLLMISSRDITHATKGDSPNWDDRTVLENRKFLLYGLTPWTRHRRESSNHRTVSWIHRRIDIPKFRASQKVGTETRLLQFYGTSPTIKISTVDEA